MRIDEYLEAVCGEIRWKAARAQVREEVRTHIEQRIDEYMGAGEDKAQAEARAVSNMGDAVKTGRALDRLHRPKYDIVFFAAVFGLIALGLLYAATTKYYDSNLLDWLIATLSAVSGCCIFTLMDFRKMAGKKFQPLFFAGVLLTIVTLAGMAIFNSNADGYLTSKMLPVFHLFIRVIGCVLLVIMCLSAGIWISDLKTGKGIVWFLVSMSVLCFLGYGFILMTCVWAMLWTVKSKKKTIGLVMLPLVSFLLPIAIGCLFDPARYLIQFRSFPGMFINDPESVQVKYMVTHLNIFGSGNMPQPAILDYVNDDILGLLNFMWQYGLVPGLAIVGLCGVMLWRVYRMLHGIRDGAGRAISIGICTYLTMTILLSILLNFGVSPFYNGTVGGTPGYLPMLSQRWELSVPFWSMAGILVGLYRRKDLYKARAVPV